MNIVVGSVSADGLTVQGMPSSTGATSSAVQSTEGSSGGEEPSVQASTNAPPDSSGSAPAKRNYPAPAGLPTQEGPKGIRFDFNDGCRVALPDAAEPWKVRLSDLDTGNILYETEIKAGRINSSKRYYVRIRIDVWQHGESVLVHEYSASERNVLVQFPVGTLGDTVGWLPYAIKFKEHHNCKLTCGIAEKLIPLFEGAYPDIKFVPHETVEPEKYYATYSMGLFFDDKDFMFQPCDFRYVGLHRTAGYILGVDPTEKPPRIALADDSRPIAEPYVCIAAQSTTQAKYWNNPNGWHDVVSFLKEAGYRVVCIDQKRVHGGGIVWNHIPHGVEDQTGDQPLTERARWIKHADFFIGLSSGLSWLAWAVGTPVVMISGFTHPTNEFETPYRVVNYHTCNSCWNDVRHRFDHGDFLWCPRHKNTPRQFECTRLITSDHVKAIIRRIPGFAVQQGNELAKASAELPTTPVASETGIRNGKKKQGKS
jgi:autotransporter strand-loop-strand O-heptosyltransferase